MYLFLCTCHLLNLLLPVLWGTWGLQLNSRAELNIRWRSLYIKASVNIFHNSLNSTSFYISSADPSETVSSLPSPHPCISQLSIPLSKAFSISPQLFWSSPALHLVTMRSESVIVYVGPHAHRVFANDLAVNTVWTLRWLWKCRKPTPRRVKETQEEQTKKREGERKAKRENSRVRVKVCGQQDHGHHKSDFPQSLWRSPVLGLPQTRSVGRGTSIGVATVMMCAARSGGEGG